MIYRPVVILLLLLLSWNFNRLGYYASSIELLLRSSREDKRKTRGIKFWSGRYRVCYFCYCCYCVEISI